MADKNSSVNFRARPPRYPVTARYEQASTLGIVGLVAGGVFATAGFVLWATEPGAETRTAAWSCVPAILGRDRPQLTCALRF